MFGWMYKRNFATYFTPYDLFSTSEPGAWYDHSDLSTLFQDAAGTTPVTAMEQPVGRMLDLSGNGNHAFQATTTKRGVVSRRVNLLTESEFRNGVSDAPTRSALVTAESIPGYLGALGIGWDGSTTVFAYKTVPVVSGASYRISAVVKMTDGNPPVFGSVTPASSLNTFIFGVGNGFATAGTYVVVPLGGGLYRVSADAIAGATVNNGIVKYPTNDNRTFKVTAYSLTLATDAHLPYQWVNTATDYDADPSKFPTYLKSDGIDDSYSCATGGGGSAGFFFSACVSRMAATNGVLFSDIALAPPYNGYYLRISAGGNAVFAAYVNNVASQVIGPALQLGAPSIVQAWDDGVNLNVRVDGGAVFSTPRPAMAAGSSGFTMGQDNGTSTGYFNGRLYSTVYRKDSAPTQVQREAVAVYQRQKARMP